MRKRQSNSWAVTNNWTILTPIGPLKEQKTFLLQQKTFLLQRLSKWGSLTSISNRRAQAIWARGIQRQRRNESKPTNWTQPWRFRERERKHYQPKYGQGPLLHRVLPTKPRSSIPLFCSSWKQIFKNKKEDNGCQSGFLTQW